MLRNGKATRYGGKLGLKPIEAWLKKKLAPATEGLRITSSKDIELRS